MLLISNRPIGPGRCSFAAYSPKCDLHSNRTPNLTTLQTSDTILTKIQGKLSFKEFCNEEFKTAEASYDVNRATPKEKNSKLL
jgi:hypothetical protein